ncbi:hypothetical protein, partial [Klebsiella pneumoniae]|uniref:hypothetical protein n=1 Tax=Klebsiella pneumoniae TaxID=573 RepID=UPI00115BE219
DVFAGKKSAQIREILISESAWEEMTCLFAPSLGIVQTSKKMLGRAWRNRDDGKCRPWLGVTDFTA